jgi:hypothetical protein
MVFCLSQQESLRGALRNPRVAVQLSGGGTMLAKPFLIQLQNAQQP